MITLGTTGAALLAMYMLPSFSPAMWICLGAGLLAGLLVPRPNHEPPATGSCATKELTGASLRVHPELQIFLTSLRHSLVELASQSDETLREAAILRLAATQAELQRLADGRIMHSTTEE